MKNICVYLGANSGSKTHFKQSVKVLGKEISEQGHTLIYGGSSLGMMGLLANTIKENGGKVIGIITRHLIDKEMPLDTLDDLIVVDTMQERKRLMQTMADSFIVMPGGLGTLEEAIETWNAIKIGEIKKPIAFFNINAYFDDLFKFMTHCSNNGFMHKDHLDVPIISEDISHLYKQLNKNATTDSFPVHAVE